MKLYCRLTHENRIVKIDTSSVVTICDDYSNAGEFDDIEYIPLKLWYSESDGSVKCVKDICDIEVY